MSIAGARRSKSNIVLLLASFVALLLPSRVVAGVDRPPQYVLMAFDNCTELDRWQELSDFSSRMNKNADIVHFTFFISGINFVADSYRNVYQGPHQRRGASNINFGGSQQDVLSRIRFVNDLRARGHEIASHAVGHFSGKSWSVADWGKEFDEFGEVLNNVGPNNRLGAEAALKFSAGDIVGFRAPYLDRSPGLYTVLKERGFRYDTSGSGSINTWPEKTGGIWRFNLAALKLEGTREMPLSMDYNVFMVQTRATHGPLNDEVVRGQTLRAYLNYFRTNYLGGRAPLHIGHHFFNYQNGAYNSALKSFAGAVCGLPEVKCVTYTALADFLDGQSLETLSAFRRGDFPRAPASNLSGLPQ
jgi:hypothetical protein